MLPDLNWYGGSEENPSTTKRSVFFKYICGSKKSRFILSVRFHQLCMCQHSLGQTGSKICYVTAMVVQIEQNSRIDDMIKDIFIQFLLVHINLPIPFLWTSPSHWSIVLMAPFGILCKPKIFHWEGTAINVRWYFWVSEIPNYGIPIVVNRRTCT